jgi:hypothetical protein
MRFRLPIYILSTAFLSWQGGALVGNLAAQEIPQCYVENKPCGTPEHLEKLIVMCLQDPNLCRDGEQRQSILVDAHGSDTGPVIVTGSGGLLSAAPSGSNRAGTSPAPRRTQGLPTPNLPPHTPATVYAVGVTEDSDVDNASGPSHIVNQIARDLPLDSRVRNLRDTMPSDSANIERRLGLRRTRVAGFDLRRKVPSPDEIVQALVNKIRRIGPPDFVP